MASDSTLGSMRWTSLLMARMSLLVLVLIQTVLSICLSVELNERRHYTIITLFSLTLLMTTVFGLIKSNTALLYINATTTLGYTLYLMDTPTTGLRAYAIAETWINAVLSLVIAVLFTIRHCAHRQLMHSRHRLRSEVATLSIKSSNGFLNGVRVLNGYDRYINRCVHNENNNNCIDNRSDNLYIISADSLSAHSYVV